MSTLGKITSFRQRRVSPDKMIDGCFIVINSFCPQALTGVSTREDLASGRFTYYTLWGLMPLWMYHLLF